MVTQGGEGFCFGVWWVGGVVECGVWKVSLLVLSWLS